MREGRKLVNPNHVLPLIVIGALSALALFYFVFWPTIEPVLEKWVSPETSITSTWKLVGEVPVMADVSTKGFSFRGEAGEGAATMSVGVSMACQSTKDENGNVLSTTTKIMMDVGNKPILDPETGSYPLFNGGCSTDQFWSFFYDPKYRDQIKEFAGELFDDLDRWLHLWIR